MLRAPRLLEAIGRCEIVPGDLIGRLKQPDIPGAHPRFRGVVLPGGDDQFCGEDRADDPPGAFHRMSRTVCKNADVAVPPVGLKFPAPPMMVATIRISFPWDVADSMKNERKLVIVI